MVRLYISAHEDDDLIFMSPCLSEDVASSEGVWTIYLTAGDAGLADSGYWREREEGERAAYSAMGAPAGGRRLYASLGGESRHPRRPTTG